MTDKAKLLGYLKRFGGKLAVTATKITCVDPNADSGYTDLDFDESGGFISCGFMDVCNVQRILNCL